MGNCFWAMLDNENGLCWLKFITLTVDVHPNGLDGRRAEAVLGLAVVAASLGPLDLCDVQRFVEDAGVLETIGHTTSCLCPPYLQRRKRENYYAFQRLDRRDTEQTQLRS